MQAIAFCPGHVTGFFKAELGQKEPELQGSVGAGFCIQEGVTTRVKVTSSEKSGFRIKDRKSTRLNSSHIQKSRMPSSA